MSPLTLTPIIHVALLAYLYVRSGVLQRPAEGTELIYSVDGGKLLADLLSMWLKRPHGALYLLNNAHRTGIKEFLEALLSSGLALRKAGDRTHDGGHMDVRR